MKKFVVRGKQKAGEMEIIEVEYYKETESFIYPVKDCEKSIYGNKIRKNGLYHKCFDTLHEAFLFMQNVKSEEYKFIQRKIDYWNFKLEELKRKEKEI